VSWVNGVLVELTRIARVVATSSHYFERICEVVKGGNSVVGHAPINTEDESQKLFWIVAAKNAKKSSKFEKAEEELVNIAPYSVWLPPEERECVVLSTLFGRGALPSGRTN
jgi:hypothetical protein